MCGRFAVTLPSDAMAQLFAARPANDLPEVPNYNVCPTNQVHVVTLEEGARRLVSKRWGLVPHWYKTPTDGPLLINARGETVADKPAFRSAVRERRCIVPASGFYEWVKDAEGHKLPFYIQPAQDEILGFAGIWQDWRRGEDSLSACAIVTIGANAAMGAIHDRMPVVLDPADWARWLGEDDEPAAPLMRPAPEDALRFFRVGTEVNSNRARGAELIAPL